MLIHEIAQRAGVSVHTIRYYEKEGLLEPQHTQRSPNNYRHYSEACIERLAMIRQGQSAGFTLSEIRNLMQVWDNGTLSGTAKIAIIEEKIAEIACKRAELDVMDAYLQSKRRVLMEAL